MMRDAWVILAAIAAIENGARLLMEGYDAAVEAGLEQDGETRDTVAEQLRRTMAERFLAHMRRAAAIHQAATS